MSKDKCQFGNALHHYYCSHCSKTNMPEFKQTINNNLGSIKTMRTHLNRQVMNDAWTPHTRLSNCLARGSVFRMIVSILIHNVWPESCTCFHTTSVNLYFLNGTIGVSEVTDNERKKQALKHIHLCWDIWTILYVCVSFERFKWILLIWEPLNRKRHLPKSVSFLSQCTDKNIWVTATAARVLSVWMTCPNLTSTHSQICHAVLAGKNNNKT